MAILFNAFIYNLIILPIQTVIMTIKLFTFQSFNRLKYKINLFRRKNMAIKSLSIRIDEEMLNKLHIVADYEGRSANSQILILIRDCVEQYEKEHGKIQLK